MKCILKTNYIAQFPLQFVIHGLGKDSNYYQVSEAFKIRRLQELEGGGGGVCVGVGGGAGGGAGLGNGRF